MNNGPSFTRTLFSDPLEIELLNAAEPHIVSLCYEGSANLLHTDHPQVTLSHTLVKLATEGSVSHTENRELYDDPEQDFLPEKVIRWIKGEV